MNQPTNDNKNDELNLEAKWKNATIANNFIFYKVMYNNPDVCKELLENILLKICVLQTIKFNYINRISKPKNFFRIFFNGLLLNTGR